MSAAPAVLPCGDPVDGSLFDMRKDRESPLYQALIVHAKREVPEIYFTAPATVWCADCLSWVNCTDGEFETLREVRR